MITENCDKYIKKAKYGIVVFSIIIIIGALKKTNVFDSLFGTSFDSLAILIIVFAFVISMILLMPYITCLSKYKRY